MIRTHTDNTKEQVSTILACSLLVLYLAVTYMALYSTGSGARSADTPLVMFFVVPLPTFWLCLRFQRYLQAVRIQRTSTEQLGQSLLGLMVRPCCVTIGMWLGGLLCMSEPPLVPIGWMVGGCIGAINPKWFRRPQPDLRPILLRGTFILPIKQVRRMLLRTMHAGQQFLLWAGLPLPEHFSADSFLILGALGSGKTVLLRMLLQSVVARIKPGSDWRALVYDAKQDMLGLLYGMALHCQVIILNPFDRRSYAWDMAKDINSPSAALEFASLMIPREKGENAFFSLAARDLVAAVILALIITRPGQWTLGEVLNILSSGKRTKRLLYSVPQTRNIAEEHFSRNSRTLTSVQYTITGYASEFRAIAALYEKSERKYSLQQWLKEESILVLGNNEELRTSIDAINRMIFNRITELLLSQSESDRRRSWIILDEIKEAGRFDGLGRLLTKGRSKGVRTAISSQTVEGMHETYGEKHGEDIMSLCGHKAFLRTDSPTTAEWCARVLGESHVLQFTESFTNGSHNSSTTINDGYAKHQAVMPSQLMRLPRADRRRFYGYYVSPGIGVYSGPVYFSRALRDPSDVPNFVGRPVEDQYNTDQPVGEKSDGRDEVRLEDIRPMTAERAMEILRDESPEDHREDGEDQLYTEGSGGRDEAS